MKSKLQFYRLCNFFWLSKSIYNLSRDICLVSFIYADIDHPMAIPIGVYTEGGIRKYIWQDRLFIEYPLPWRDVLRTMTLNGAPQKALDLLEQYKSFIPAWGRAATCRALYGSSVVETV